MAKTRPTARRAGLMIPADAPPSAWRAAALLDALIDAGAQPIGPLSLLLGQPLGESSAPQVALVLAWREEAALAPWIDACAARGMPCVVVCASDASAQGLGAWLGHGVIVAHEPRAPLAGAPLAMCRQELARGVARGAQLGYAPRALWCAPNSRGACVDGLVLDEAARAGFTMLLTPGQRAPDPMGLMLRMWRPDDSPEALAAWVMGRTLAARARGAVALAQTRVEATLGARQPRTTNS